MKRPQTIEDFERTSAGYCTEEGLAKGLSYQPDPTDIIISPYAKCGTTWMQQIVHGLRSGGDMNFGEITEAVPWIEMAHDIDLDLYAPQISRPHAFKSHLAWNKVPKGGKYIVVFRDPLDAVNSFFRFLDGWFFEEGSISLESFAEHYLNRDARGDYWSHAASWWGQRDNPDVLLFSFEHMKQDLPGVVERVAQFMGGYDEERVALATHQASFDFMKAHAHQFDDNYLKSKRDAVCGLPPGGGSLKVSKGKTGTGKQSLSPEMRAKFDARWQETMGQAYGLRDYAALLDQLRA